MRVSRICRVAAELFPTPTSVLPAADPWCLPTTVIPTTSRSTARIASVLTQKDFQTGWHLFGLHPQQYSKEALSRLLAIFPSGAETAHVWLPRALQVKSALADRLSTQDYTVLLNLAGNSANISLVESLWSEMSAKGVPKDVHAWNQYISAMCDANPRFWPWPRSRSKSYARYVTSRNPNAAQVVRNDFHVLTMLDRMDVENVPKNERTLELLLLALAREALARGNSQVVTTLTTLARRVWGANGRQPSLSALTAIANAFALHSHLVDGFRLSQQLVAEHAKPLGLNSPAAHQYWRTLLRLVVSQTEPRNNVPQTFFAEVWNTMLERGFVPTVGCQSIRLEFLEMKNQFHAMLRAIPEILPLSTSLAQSALQRAIVGLANTDRAMEAVKQLQWARGLGLEPTVDLEAFLAEKGATVQQLQLFEEDDDEDTII